MLRLRHVLLGTILVLTACGAPGRSDDDGSAAASREALVGTWVYLATSWEEDGETKTLGIGGDLNLGADDRFQQNRRIGSVYNTASGTWSVEGDVLHLDSDFRFVLGEDADGETLTLSFESEGTRYTYALRKASS